MKQTILHLVVSLCVVGLAHADQTIQSVQQALQDQGFYYGNVSGDMNAATTAAIRRYQIRNGLHVTGEINPETRRSLNLNSNSATSSRPTPAPAVVQSNNSPPDESLQPNRAAPPPSSTEPDRQLEINPSFSVAPYQPASRSLNRSIVAEVQHQLMSRGYYQGRVDGRYGPQTVFAMREFQLRSGLPPTGHLDTSTLGALGLSDANFAYFAPAPRHYEARVPVWKFKHGRWKVKWKKFHRYNRDEYRDEHRAEYGGEHDQGDDD